MIRDKGDYEVSEYDLEFEDLGEPEVRRRLAAKQGLHVTRWSAAEAWLVLKESERVQRAENSSAKRDVRDDEALAIAREANSLARSATFAATAAAAAASEANAIARTNRTVSVVAATIAAVAAIIAIFKQ